MEKIKNNGKIFAFGAVGYFLLETLWRGHSHWSMAAAGGLSLLCLIKIFKKLWRKTWLNKFGNPQLFFLLFRRLL